MYANQDKQKSALIFSALSAGIFAITGLLLGVMSGSVMIIFDSAYSLLSLALASLSLFALKLARQPANANYPFGRLTIEPLSILIKGVVIGLVCLVSMVLAAISLWQGGREVNLNLALIFSLLNVAGCYLTWWVIRRAQQRQDTALLRAEVRQWQMDTWLSAAVLFGFILAQLLAMSPWGALAVYADPLMVLVIAGYFCYIPYNMVVQALRQLMLGAADPEVAAQVREVVAAAHPEVPSGTEPVRVAQVGSFLIVQHAEVLATEAQQALQEIAADEQLTAILIQPQTLDLTEPRHQ
ncbi:cation diffusion facilitator family transporter [Aliidiomarina maris]|uniref:Cation diffusion facilitator family transporter n=1 Tax=Aliidiomarina maris TaxID=531312 RepID=A0A327X6Q3_9GAMM|nr:cation diffusion facilitator family transporter [Aliidiomarina maris]MCL5050123.1 cation diffusion facilitator family transporter [Bacillota bacterium]RAK01563.1 cation diffusion facilitator family transporter [Aliidiomarina maris]RUO28397.1 cation transporter [Aliidiomarina maris]